MTVHLVVPVELTAHLTTALEFHLRRCREQGVPVPPGLLDLRDWAQVVARGLSDSDPLPASHGAGVDKLLLTLPEAAAALGFGLTKVKALAAKGDLPTVTVGKVRRVRAVDLEEYVARLAGAQSFRDRVEAKSSASAASPVAPADRPSPSAGALSPGAGPPPLPGAPSLQETR